MLPRRLCLFCEGQFSAVRKGHIFCSDTCRKLSFKVKKRLEAERRLNRRLETKLKKLAASPFGKYLCKELRRAGTVQALSGHTSESLRELVDLRRRCTASGGYEKGVPIGAYELSHIYPVSCPKRLGLLHPLNLVICPKDYNRKHSRKTPKIGYLGLSIERIKLEKKWSILDTYTSLQALELASKFLGDEFKKWLKSHSISYTQHRQLLKKLISTGIPDYILNPLNLEQLKALADDKEIPYFNHEIQTENLFDVIADESERFELDKELSLTISHLYDVRETFLRIATLEFLGTEQEIDNFTDFVCRQVLNAIHGQSYEATWRRKKMSSYFCRKKESVSSGVDDYDEIL
jgi:hypothetical protein